MSLDLREKKQMIMHRLDIEPEYFYQDAVGCISEAEPHTPSAPSFAAKDGEGVVYENCPPGEGTKSA